MHQFSPGAKRLLHPTTSILKYPPQNAASSHKRGPKRSIHIPNSELIKQRNFNCHFCQFRFFVIVTIIAIIHPILLEVLGVYGMTSDMTFASLVPSTEFTISTLMSASALATPKPTVRASGSTTRCGASTPPTRRPLPVQHDLTTPRARARAARLRANEAAERREDLAALVTTPVSHPFFHLSVRCRRTDAIRLHCLALFTPVTGAMLYE